MNFNQLRDKFSSFDLSSRLIVAFACIPLLLLVPYLGFMPMVILWTLIWFHMLSELSSMISLKDQTRDAFLFGGLVYYVVLSSLLFYTTWSVSLALVCWIMYPLSIWLLISFSKSKNFFVLWSYINYVTLPVLFLLLIYQSQGPLAMMIILITIWALDTLSYFTGVSMGRHPIAPRLSAKKTIEGTIGGIIGASFVFIGLLQLLNFPSIAVQPFLFALLLTFSAFTGDLLESFLKRQFKIKDSGVVLKGHGGMLDRFDSLLFFVFSWFILLLS